MHRKVDKYNKQCKPDVRREREEEREKKGVV